MPAPSVWAIRLALLQLILAFSAGGWLLASRGLPSLPRPDWLLPVHLELALLGWTLQLAMGVAYWMLPKFKTGPPRGNTGPAIAALVMFNVGVATLVAGFMSGAPVLQLMGRASELAAVGLFAVNAWPRIKAFGT
ncbi:MAG TPA: hypothetical protein VMK53_10775 [Gemmatimonadales bacterium]|nr:hypothetical protein [Gemmatimonadales bacterium]